MSSLSPNQTLAKVAEALPATCRAHMIVIGSLAVGCHFFKEDRDMFIQTKDIDSVVIEQKIQVATRKHNEFLTQLGLHPLPLGDSDGE